jgi:hypothetical protein
VAHNHEHGRRTSVTRYHLGTTGRSGNVTGSYPTVPGYKHGGRSVGSTIPALARGFGPASSKRNGGCSTHPERTSIPRPADQAAGFLNRLQGFVSLPGFWRLKLTGQISALYADVLGSSPGSPTKLVRKGEHLSGWYSWCVRWSEKPEDVVRFDARTLR